MSQPEIQVQTIIDALARQPENPALAALVWTDAALDAALSMPVEMANSVLGDAIGSLHGPSSPDGVESEPRLASDLLAAAYADDQTSLDTGAAPPPTRTGRTTDVPPARASDAPLATHPSVEDTPLALIAMQIAELVAARGSLSQDELASAYAARYDVVVPTAWHRTLNRFAWTAKGLRYLELEGDTWWPGAEEAHVDKRYGDWTFTRIVHRAAELLRHDDDPFNELLTQVYAGNRTPKLIMSMVGSAINQARRERQLGL